MGIIAAIALLGLLALSAAGSPKASTVRKPPPGAGTTDQRTAASELARYLAGGGKSKSIVKQYQARMGGIPVDGLMGPRTRDRMLTLGAIRPVAP